MNRRTAGRLGAGLAAAVAVLVLGAGPAAADPPRPTDFRSTITEVDPPLPARVEVRIIGGDSLLELRVPRGQTALVADYPSASEGSAGPAVPYLRFDADGTVRRNRLAVATAANGARYGTASDVPDPDAEPRWEVVATDGTYAWHDHRIHWMSPAAPRAVAADGLVDLGGPGGTWTVPIVIGDEPTTITGTLVLEPAPSILPALAVALVVLASTAWLGRRCLRRASIAGIVVGSGAVAVAVATWRAIPPDVGGTAIPVIVAGVAVLAGWLGALGPHRTRLAAVAGCAAALLGWSISRIAVLRHAILPTPLEPWVDRSVTAAAIGAGLGLATALVWRPAPTEPSADLPLAPTPPTASPTA